MWDVHKKVTKKDVCFIATIVVDGVNVFHQVMLVKIKIVVLAIEIGRNRQENQNVHEIKN